MPIKKEAEPIYRVADLFRQRCLAEGQSLLWPQHRIWTPQNISALRDAFIEKPDTGKRSFFDKWHDQLADQPEDLHRIATDVVAFYHLFPGNVGRDAKLRDVNTVMSWKLAQEQPGSDLEILEQAYCTSIGNPGIHYLIGRPWQIAFYLDFAKEPETMPSVATELSKSRGNPKQRTLSPGCTLVSSPSSRYEVLLSPFAFKME
jgi:hypothetical protein